MSSHAAIHERYSQAVNSEAPLAKHGVNLFDAGAEHLADSLRINHDSIRDFLEAQGMDREHFQQPLIHIKGYAELNPDNRKHGQTLAGIAIQPVTLQDQTYFPYIQLAIESEQPNINALNKNFRHELGHFKNGDIKVPFYARPGSDNLVRLMGMSAIMHNYLPPTPMGESNIEIATQALITTAGIFATMIPHDFSHTLEPIEMRANHFARKHRAFRPISLTEE